MNLDQIQTRRLQQLRGMRHLLDTLPLAPRPDLGRQESVLVHGRRQEITKHALRRGVHRRSINESPASREERVQYLFQRCTRRRRLTYLERPRRTKAKDRYLFAA